MRLIIEAKCFLKDDEHLINKFGLAPGGRAQRAVDTSSLRYSEKYMPMRSGSLIKRTYSETVVGSGELVFPGPYAHYLYHGEVYGPSFPIFDDDSGEPTMWRSRKNIKKHATGKPLNISTEKNPNATSHWWEVAKANHWKQILVEAQKAVRGSSER